MRYSTSNRPNGVPLKSGLKVIENGTFGSVFDLSKNSGGPERQQDFLCGAQMEALTGESRRREDRGAEGSRVWGWVSPPQPTKGSGGAS